MEMQNYKAGDASASASSSVAVFVDSPPGLVSWASSATLEAGASDESLSGTASLKLATSSCAANNDVEVELEEEDVAVDDASTDPTPIDSPSLRA